MPTTRKKLIEVALPLEAFHRKAARGVRRSSLQPGTLRHAHAIETAFIQSVRRLVRHEPDSGFTSVNYNFAELLQRAEAPS